MVVVEHVTTVVMNDFQEFMRAIANRLPSSALVASLSLLVVHGVSAEEH